MKIKIDQADQAFSAYIRAKYPRCQVCGKQATQVHHFKGRRFQAVRFSEENAWAVCFTCHRRFHEEPDWAVDIQEKRFDKKDNYILFILTANTICKRTSEEKKIIAAHFRDELKKLKGG